MKNITKLAAACIACFLPLCGCAEAGVQSSSVAPSETVTTEALTTASEAVSDSSAEQTCIMTTAAITTDSVSVSDSSDMQTEITTANSDNELIETANRCFEAACEKYWEYSGGSKFTCDFQQVVIENEKEYYLVTTEGFNSLADIEKDWNSVFSVSKPVKMPMEIVERVGRLWGCIGDRGKDIEYVKTQISGIKEKSESGEIVFIASSYYQSHGNNGADESHKENDFAIISENGEYKVSEFTLPY